ncbi:MAG: ATP-dependent 6-phosphofructokinase [Xenococcaceae cyanobacterium]
MNTRKRLGILTSGGDCPGLNAVIRAVLAHAILTYNWEVVGIPYGSQGLVERKSIPLNAQSLNFKGIDPLLSTGGTILKSISKAYPGEKAEEIISGYRDLGLDALIAIGGDGSLGIQRSLAQKGGWNLVGVPKTIDNDVSLTERSVGFDTAVNTVTDALYRLSFTASSHDRVMVVEVMGRTAGHLALHAGIAGGADAILIPEIPYSIEKVCETINQVREMLGRRFAIVVVAEGAQTPDGESRTYTDALGEVRLRGIGEYVADQICRASGQELEARVMVLGHIQRGGVPSAFDRLLATEFGKTAVDLVASEQYDKMVAWQCGKVTSVSLGEVIAKGTVLVDPNGSLVQTARALGIYVGH